MKLKNTFFMSISLVTLISCTSIQQVQKPIETVEVEVPLEVGLSFVPRLVFLRIDYRDSDGQSGLTSMAEIDQVIPMYGKASGNMMPEPISPEKAYNIFLRSKK